MKSQHETLVALEDKCRKMAQVIKEKKRKRQELRLKEIKESQKVEGETEEQQVVFKPPKEYTRKDLENLELKLQIAEADKLKEERKHKEVIKAQEVELKNLQVELQNVTQHVKEKDQEYRLNELKIKELRRQLPQKILKPLDLKAQA